MQHNIYNGNSEAHWGRDCSALSILTDKVNRNVKGDTPCVGILEYGEGAKFQLVIIV